MCSLLLAIPKNLASKLLSAAPKKTIMLHDERTKTGTGPAAQVGSALAAKPPGPAWALLHGELNTPVVC